MKIVCFRGTDVPEDTVRALAGHSFLASEQFASVWTARGGSRVVWGVETQGRLTAVLPGIEFGRRPVRRFMAMPNGLYGRLCLAPEYEALREGIATKLMEAIGGGEYIKAYLFDYFDEILPSHVKAEADEQTAWVIDIGAADWRPLERNLRQEIRKASREGLTVRKIGRASCRERV